MTDITSYSCKECNKTHEINMSEFFYGDTGEPFKKLIKKYNHKFSIIGDVQTIKASENILDILGDHQIICLNNDNNFLEPTIENANKLFNLVEGSELLIAVGTGTIIDLVKYVAFKRSLPYVIFFTAVSINGVASNKSVIIEGSKKITYTVSNPIMTLCDEEVINNSPRLINSYGYADIICVPFCISDWKIAAQVSKEHYCSLPFSLWGKYKSILSENGFSNRKQMSEVSFAMGVSASVAGTSFPLSGAEHLISYYLDEFNRLNNLPQQAHGLQIGIATIIVAALYEKAISKSFCFNKLNGTLNFTPYIPIENLNDIQKLEHIIKNNFTNYQKAKEVLDNLSPLPTASNIKELLKQSGISIFPLLYSKEVLADAILYAAALRDRYTILNVFLDSGNLDCKSALNLVEDFLC